MEGVVSMKKFLRFDCILNAYGFIGFVFVSLFLFFAWQNLSAGSVLIKAVTILILLYFLLSAAAGLVLIAINCVGRIRHECNYRKWKKRIMAERDLDK